MASFTALQIDYLEVEMCIYIYIHPDSVVHIYKYIIINYPRTTHYSYNTYVQIYIVCS